MQYINFKDDLNEKQYEAVTTEFQNVRVVAGAGSGKTRVLTYRIAYLLSEMNVDPWKILAITFTNKVANEMKARVTKMLPEFEKNLTIRTFHSFAANFLRHEISTIGYPASFTILDEEDQTKLVKDIAAEMGFKKSDKIVQKTISYIAACKLKEKYPDEISIDHENFEDEKTCLEIYHRYEETKSKNYALDFDDLLLKTNYILENYVDIRMKWQQRIDHILVDEFQDTNDTEYRMIKFLSKPFTSLYVVGDPDQTIYTWRGANQKIIMELEKQFADVQTIILDRNYRSTQIILDSANKLIAHNKMRIHKDLYTKNTSGSPIVVKSCPSGRDEADYVAREIIKLKQQQGLSYKDIVVLYRSSYVTLDFESAFTMRGIPHKIYGGQKFYQRKEIKDVLAYFHLIVNPKDNISMERIINVPRRGIGEQTLLAIRSESAAKSLSILEYIRDVDPENTELGPKILNSLKTMVFTIDKAREEIAKNEETFSKILEDMLSSLGYNDYLIQDDDGEERLEHVKALFEDLRHYLKNNPESTFDEYLQNIALLSAQDEIIDGDYVTLMTVHVAKGLEFPCVFVVRFNNGVFPHIRTQTESGYKGLEEERRLAYVAMTRAKERLYLTLAGDYSYVLNGNLTPSPFLKESGNEVLDSTRHEYNPYRTQTRQTSFHFDDGPNHGFESDVPRKQNFDSPTNGIKEWKIGEIVLHDTLGRGVVIGLEGDGIIKVKFEQCGIKLILGNHPKVKKGEFDA